MFEDAGKKRGTIGSNQMTGDVQNVHKQREGRCGNARYVTESLLDLSES